MTNTEPLMLPKPGADKLVGAGPKLALASGVIVGVTIYLALVGARADWQYYLTADECLAQSSALIGERLRVSGTVAPGTLQVAADRRSATFHFASHGRTLTVTSTSLVPDNLAENRDVVAEGRLENPRVLRADKLITRCASKYESRLPEADVASISGRDGPRR